VQISALPESAPVPLPDGVQLLRANNPGPMTLAGTNTWVLRRDGAEPRSKQPIVVIDPGPLLDDHLAAIRACGRPAAIVLTHHHFDHSEAAPTLAVEFDAPVYAADPEHAKGTGPLAEGDVVSAGGWALHVMSTPGHTSDSVCIRVDTSSAGESVLFTGDTLLGGSTTIIAPPSGDLAEYFETMHRLSTFVDVSGLPGHGPAFSSVGEWASHNASYREARLAQLADLFTTIRDSAAYLGDAELLARVSAAAYGEGGASVAPYIETMANAQLRFLAGRGQIAPWDYVSPPIGGRGPDEPGM
jgi:glyoxylase-like metal-dependent hydrolase (beta-lactamase superfamily II)